MNIRGKSIVKEYTFEIEGLSFPVKARITELFFYENEIALPYVWEISHYYKQSRDHVEPYSPGAPYGMSTEQVEKELLRYVKNFTLYGVTPNPSF